MPKTEKINVSLNLGVLKVEGIWATTDDDAKAAWEMYVQLITRISVIELQPHEGSLREALSSLHSLFDTTRAIMIKYGSGVAQAKAENDITFGFLAVVILNYALRPLLSNWHPLLLDYEERRPTGVTQMEHERNWEKNAELRQELNEARAILIQYANYLARVANIPSLIIDEEKPTEMNEPETLPGWTLRGNLIYRILRGRRR